MYKVFYFLFFLSFMNTGCAEKAPLSGRLILNGETWAPVVYLIQPNRLDDVAASFVGQVIDSAVIDDDGYFVFDQLPNMPDPTLLELVVQKKGERYLNRLNNEDLASANYFPFVWKNGDQIQISAESSQFQNSFAMVNPSPENAALIELRDIRWQAFQQYLQQKSTKNHDEEQLLEVEAAHLNFQKTIIDFAQYTTHLLPAMVAVRWASPQNDYEKIPEFLFFQCQKWKTLSPNHSWVKELCSKSSREQLPTLKGDQLPDFALPMLSGDTISISELLGEQLTILDLWASWCAPCRLENRNVLVPLWEKYHDNGFQIIGYALDGSEHAWKKAIDKDGAYQWLHASHLKGDDAPLLDELRLSTIPANFILDKNGVVLAKNLHGEALTQFVEEWMK